MTNVQAGDVAAKIAAIEADPLFLRLTRSRMRLSFTLAAVMAAIYFSFVLCVAFAPGLLGRRIAEDTAITWGIVAGVSIIVSGFVLTAIYVVWANTRFDALNARLLERLK